MKRTPKTYFLDNGATCVYMVFSHSEDLFKKGFAQKSSEFHGGKMFVWLLGHVGVRSSMRESRQLPNYRGSLYLRNMDPGTDQLHFFFLQGCYSYEIKWFPDSEVQTSSLCPWGKVQFTKTSSSKEWVSNIRCIFPGRCHADRQLFTRQIHYNRRTNSQQQCNNIQETLQVNCMCRQ